MGTKLSRHFPNLMIICNRGNLTGPLLFLQWLESGRRISYFYSDQFLLKRCGRNEAENANQIHCARLTHLSCLHQMIEFSFFALLPKKLLETINSGPKVVFQSSHSVKISNNDQKQSRN